MKGGEMETGGRATERGWMSRLMKEIEEESKSWPEFLRYQLGAVEQPQAREEDRRPPAKKHETRER
jgi:hypothetical protein